jgi:predicted N-acetyltransferase YhbS
VLVTHPDYERRGAGSLLVQWGCEQADKDGAAAYIDASAAGKGLYSKFGFEDRSDPAFSVPNIYSMVREPRNKEA